MEKKNNSRWNDSGNVQIIERASKQEQENLTNKMFDTMIKNANELKRKN